MTNRSTKSNIALGLWAADDNIGDMPEENPGDPAEPGEQDRTDKTRRATMTGLTTTSVRTHRKL